MAHHAGMALGEAVVEGLWRDMGDVMGSKPEFNEHRRNIDAMMKKARQGERVPSLADADEYMVLQVVNNGSDKYYMDWDWLRFHS